MIMATLYAHMTRLVIDDKLFLRPLEMHDAEELFVVTHQCREYLREWLPWLDTTQSVGDTKMFIESTLRQRAANNGFQAGIWHDEKLVGVIGFHRMDWPNRSTSIGYWLDKQFQGQGIMTKSAKKLVDYAFGEMNLHRIEIRCAVQNHKSRAIPERLGFINEGFAREAEWLYDHYVDHIIYGMLAHDWKQM